MTAMRNFRANAFDRRALEPLADWLVVAVAVSLPWSTSATGILVGLWLLAVLPTLDVAAVRRELATAAGGLPVLLWALASLGLLWADVSWSERLGGFAPFNRLLVIPLLLAQFRRSERGLWVLAGFFASVTAVLVLSWALVLFPALPWRANDHGVPVKDYVLQSGDFLLCAFVLLAVISDNCRAGRWRMVAGLLALAGLFLANIAFVVTARTALLVAPVMFLLLGWRQFRWPGLIGALTLFCVLGAAAVLASPYLRARLNTSAVEFHAYETNDAVNSTSMHLEFIKKSFSFVKTAPIIGHGTGTIADQFRKSAVGETGVAAIPSVNPHNQILAVAIQLGLVGAAVLVAMWIAHLMLFRGAELTAWIGLLVVTQNIVGSLVNSHLFDFTQAWLYIFGVGVAGGMALQKLGSGPAGALAGKTGATADGSS
jgi:O-antigen ligase